MNLKNKYGIREIHTRNLYRMEKDFSYLNANPHQRLDILVDIFSLISRINVKLISVVIDKNEYYNDYTDDAVENRAWTYLFERCDMCIADLGKETGNYYENGLIISDHHTSDMHDEEIRRCLQAIRIHGSAYHTIKHVIEEALFVTSRWRNFIQLADAIAYCSVMFILKDDFFIKQFMTIQNQFRKDRNGNIRNSGFKVFPERDVLWEDLNLPP
jgi:hypothetical protein